jgi:hypothetical protein
MLLQLCKIESNCFLIMLMAQTLLLYTPRMKNAFNNISIMKGGGGDGFWISPTLWAGIKGLFTAFQ